MNKRTAALYPKGPFQWNSHRFSQEWGKPQQCTVAPHSFQGGTGANKVRATLLEVALIHLVLPASFPLPPGCFQSKFTRNGEMSPSGSVRVARCFLLPRPVRGGGMSVLPLQQKELQQNLCCQRSCMCRRLKNSENTEEVIGRLSEEEAGWKGWVRKMISE